MSDDDCFIRFENRPTEPFEFRLYDIAEYNSLDFDNQALIDQELKLQHRPNLDPLINYIVCFGRNPKGERVAVYVKNVPHDIYLPVPDWFTNEDTEVFRVILNDYLINCNQDHQEDDCQRTMCNCEFIKEDEDDPDLQAIEISESEIRKIKSEKIKTSIKPEEVDWDSNEHEVINGVGASSYAGEVLSREEKNNVIEMLVDLIQSGVLKLDNIHGRQYKEQMDEIAQMQIKVPGKRLEKLKQILFDVGVKLRQGRKTFVEVYEESDEEGRARMIERVERNSPFTKFYELEERFGVGVKGTITAKNLDFDVFNYEEPLIDGEKTVYNSPLIEEIYQKLKRQGFQGEWPGTSNHLDVIPIKDNPLVPKKKRQHIASFSDSYESNSNELSNVPTRIVRALDEHQLRSQFWKKTITLPRLSPIEDMIRAEMEDQDSLKPLVGETFEEYRNRWLPVWNDEDAEKGWENMQTKNRMENDADDIDINVSEEKNNKEGKAEWDQIEEEIPMTDAEKEFMEWYEETMQEFPEWGGDYLPENEKNKTPERASLDAFLRAPRDVDKIEKTYEEEPLEERTEHRYISFQPCKEQRKNEEKAVLFVEVVKRRGFVGYEEKDRKFMRFALTGAYHAYDAQECIEAFNTILYYMDECHKAKKTTKTKTGSNSEHRFLFEDRNEAEKFFKTFRPAPVKTPQSNVILHKTQLKTNEQVQFSRYVRTTSTVSCGFLMLERFTGTRVKTMKSVKETHAQHEIVVDFEDLKEMKVQPTNSLDSSYKAPVITAVIDIETLGDDFLTGSDPNSDPIGVIAVQIVNDLDPTKNKRAAFISNAVEPSYFQSTQFGRCMEWYKDNRLQKIKEPADDGVITQIFEVRDEFQLIQAFHKFLRKEDPDILCGYNSNAFDIPFLIRRVERWFEQGLVPDYVAREYGHLSLFKEFYSKHQPHHKSTSQGERKTGLILNPGRTCFDLYFFCLNNLKLRRYRLADVIEHVDPKLRKGDVDYEKIRSLFNGNVADRRKLVEYCVNDCFVTAKIMDSLNAVTTLVAQSQVFRARPTDVLDKGQLHRNSRLIRSFTKGEYLIPSSNKAALSKYEESEEYLDSFGESTEYEGGHVFDPIRNRHNFVASLDFNSLYPSIIRAHNLCHSTFVFSKEHMKKNNLKIEDFDERPDLENDEKKKPKFMFVKKHVKEGVLPKMLTSLLESRKYTKRLRDECNDPKIKQALDAEQNSYKLCANSVYGLLGLRGELENFAAASAVTSFGRHYLVKTKEAVEAKYGDKITFVYGDTDSVLFSLEKSCKTLDEARKLAIEITDWLNTSNIFPPEMKIEFEKIFKVMLLQDKKRYAGNTFSAKIGDTKNKFFSRGLETVRRDVPPYVTEVLDELLHRMLVKEQTDDELLAYVRNLLQNLLLDKVNPEKLKIGAVTTKPLEEYSIPSKTPHVEAARELVRRGYGFTVGDRIEYVYANTGSSSKTGKVKPWSLFLEDNFTIDVKEYFDRLSAPLERALFYIPEEKRLPYFDVDRYDAITPSKTIEPAKIPFDSPWRSKAEENKKKRKKVKPKKGKTKKLRISKRRRQYLKALKKLGRTNLSPTKNVIQWKKPKPFKPKTSKSIPADVPFNFTSDFVDFQPPKFAKKRDRIRSVMVRKPTAEEMSKKPLSFGTVVDLTDPVYDLRNLDFNQQLNFYPFCGYYPFLNVPLHFFEIQENKSIALTIIPRGQANSSVVVTNRRTRYYLSYPKQNCTIDTFRGRNMNTSRIGQTRNYSISQNHFTKFNFYRKLTPDIFLETLSRIIRLK